jgi:hypothetical protein
MSAHPLFALPRTTRPADWFERLLPTAQVSLPLVTVQQAVVYHVLGAGGGTWSVFLHQGRLRTQPGATADAVLQVCMTAAHFREALTGALRDRACAVLNRLGLPLDLPDFARLPIDLAGVAQRLARLQGSLAVEVADRELADRYRYVITFGAGPAAYDTASTTLEIDADDLAAMVTSRTPPLKVLASGKLRIRGDADLPLRVLRAALGDRS